MIRIEDSNLTANPSVKMLLSVKGNRTPLCAYRILMYVISIELPTLNLSFLREGTGLMLILMCVPLAFSLLNRFTHNPPLEAPLIYIPSLAFVGEYDIGPLKGLVGKTGLEPVREPS